MTLLAAYAFDEGTGATAAEASGGPAISGIPAWDTGRHGSSMRINGVAGPEVDPFSVSGAFTIMLDAYLVGVGGNGYNIILSNNEIGNLQVPASGVLDWYGGPSTPGSTVPLATWVNLAISASGTQRKIYLDGVLVGTGNLSTLSGTSPVKLWGFAGYEPNLRLDNLRFFDTALSDAEVAALAGTAVAPAEEEPPPPPANVAPVVDGGANRSIYLGQSTTLTATATDSDGTVASYDWFQTSGPATTLAGAGASRTFTPVATGTYVFAVTATDDDGESSVPDSVTVTVLAVPAPSTPSTGGSQPVAKLGSIERALMALFVRDLEALGETDARVGADWPREIDDFYVRIDRGPGGRTSSFEGDFVVDVDVFSEDYLKAEDISEDIEVLLLSHGIVSVVADGRKWTFDGIFQNRGITDMAWDGDDDTHRLSATYAFTVRRGRA